MPTFVGTASNNYTSVSQAPLTYSPVVGNMVLLAVTTAGNGTTAAVQDNAGNDIFNNPLNAWSLLSNIAMDNGLRMEVWVCLKVVAAFTSVKAVFSQVNAQCDIGLLEYSGAAIGGFGAVSNSGFSNLFFVGTAANNSALLVTFFNCQQSTIAVGSGIYAPNGKPLQAITPGVQRLIQNGASNKLLVQEQTTIVKEELIVEAVTTSATLVVNGISAIGVVLTGGITLATPAGFSPLDESLLVAGTVLNFIKVDQISQNGQFGMVRPEFFYSLQADGSTVPLPVSPVDGYNYVADELYYLYTPLTTFDPSTNWPSGTGLMFYAQWFVDQLTGVVTCKEYYHPDGNKPVNGTSDGQLLVLTVGQRARGALGITTPPIATQIDFTKFAVDKPTTQDMMQTLARNSKFAAVKAEVIYCGEFVDGQVVPSPVSPEDGYQYSYAETKFMSSWRWTTSPTAFAPPPMASANGGNSDGGWSQLNELQSSVSAFGVVGCKVFFYNHGVIDPTTAPNGSTAYGRLAVFAFCQRATFPVGIPALVNNGGPSASTISYVDKLAPSPGTVTGKLAVTIASGSGGSLALSHLVIKRTLAGSLSVVDTTPLTFSGSNSVTLGPSTYKTSDVLSSFTFDTAHDYYLIAVVPGGANTYIKTSPSVAAGGAQLNTTSPTPYTIAGDISGATSMAGMSQDTLYNIIASVLMTIVDPNLANGFAEVPITTFKPGQPLLASPMLQIAKNVQEGCYAVEFFGPANHVNGDTISLPTSPIDGYNYSRTELFYIWNWHDTGTAAIRLFGFGASISTSGVVSTFVWHCPTGGPPTNYGAGGSHSGDGSIDVLVIACRSKLNPHGGSGGTATTQGAPSDVASLAIGGSGGFTVNGV